MMMQVYGYSIPMMLGGYLRQGAEASFPVLKTEEGDFLKKSRFQQTD